MKIFIYALTCAFMFSFAPVAMAGGVFSGFDGWWKGHGFIHMKTGKKEGVTCRATYFPSHGNTRLKVTIRCANRGGLQIVAKGHLTSNGNKISGTFEEHTYNVRGTVSGNVNDGNISATIRGGDWNSKLYVTGKGAHVTLKPRSKTVSEISISFRKG